ncbi:hypothetical protein BJG93_26550 [Paraburkholderia sprentiae WSM5005]|uniref:Lipoprotein n=1 Tax=Paraburkholderia sprentiae WSM5005 TaxID=754502 RepID=A0A1I9YRK7_9BURK|nr:hypothetical protein [Paraburkholderia sprentiae]APA88850.1 hypothetical protein BJG93_26550 [Paraburkholderia sprentiae WSM5005]
MKIDVSVKLGAALVSGCLALGFAQGSFAQTGNNPSMQKSKPGGQPGASQEESRTPDTTSANDANGNVGEAGGATNGVAGGGNGKTTHKRFKGATPPRGGSGAGQ